jgi:hypothetical protein
MQRLREDFVTCWVLAKDLPRLAEEAAEPAARALAALAHEEYLYPVDSQVYSPEGELLDHVCANDLFADPERRYHALLDSAEREE